MNELELENKKLREENRRLRKELDEALKLIAQLKKTIEELKDEIATLKKNSTTSSKPPSSDIVKPPHERRQKGVRKAGAQAKHSAHKMKLIPAEKVSQFKKLELTKCPHCQHKIEMRTGTKRKFFQTIELCDKPTVITQYEWNEYYCEHCKKIHRPELPQCVKKQDHYGERFKALIVELKSKGLSYSDIQNITKDVFDIDISKGGLSKIIRSVGEILKPVYEEIENSIKEEPVLHIDETGWKEDGKRLWVWAFCNKQVAYFKVGCSRTKNILEEILGTNYSGTIISDFYGAYKKFTSGNKQFCIAHLIRDIKFLTTLTDEEAKKFGEKLLGYYTEIFKIWHQKSEIPIEQLKIELKKYKDKIYHFLSMYKHTDSSTHISKMRKRLKNAWNYLFTFIDNPELIEPTNNYAERTIRCITKIRLLTQGTRSEWGRLWWSIIMTITGTCKIKKISAFKFILSVVNAKNRGEIYPTLLAC